MTDGSVVFPRPFTDPALRTQVANILARAVDPDTTGDVEIMEAAAGWIYDRKGYWSVDTLGTDRNPSYGDDRDDLVMMAVVRVERSVAEEIGLLDLDRWIRDEVLEAQRDEVSKMREALARAEAALLIAETRTRP